MVAECPADFVGKDPDTVAIAPRMTKGEFRRLVGISSTQVWRLKKRGLLRLTPDGYVTAQVARKFITPGPEPVSTRKRIR
jgi:hypothetical protein